MCAETEVAGKVLVEGLVWITLSLPCLLSHRATASRVRSAQPATNVAAGIDTVRLEVTH